MDSEKRIIEDTEKLTAAELALKVKVKVDTIYYYVSKGMPYYSKIPLRFIESQCWIWIRERNITPPKDKKH